MSPASGLASAYLLRTPLEGILNGKKRRSAGARLREEGERRSARDEDPSLPFVLGFPKSRCCRHVLCPTQWRPNRSHGRCQERWEAGWCRPQRRSARLGEGFRAEAPAEGTVNSPPSDPDLQP